MSKYIEDLEQQLKGKDIKAFTKELQAQNNISKILRDQRQKEQNKKAEREIQKILKGL